MTEADAVGVYALLDDEKNLPDSFDNVLIKRTPNEVVIRSNCNGVDEMRDWVSEFGGKSRTKWNVRYTYPGLAKIGFECHHSSHGKRVKEPEQWKVRLKCTKCRSKIAITVKFFENKFKHVIVTMNPALTLVMIIFRVAF